MDLEEAAVPLAHHYAEAGQVQPGIEWWSRAAEREAGRFANREAAASREVADFLVELFEVSDPSQSRGNSVTAREILNRGVERIGAELEVVHAIDALEVAAEVFGLQAEFQDDLPLSAAELDELFGALQAQ